MFKKTDKLTIHSLSRQLFFFYKEVVNQLPPTVVSESDDRTFYVLTKEPIKPVKENLYDFYAIKDKYEKWAYFRRLLEDVYIKKDQSGNFITSNWDSNLEVSKKAFINIVMRPILAYNLGTIIEENLSTEVKIVLAVSSGFLNGISKRDINQWYGDGTEAILYSDARIIFDNVKWKFI